MSMKINLFKFETKDNFVKCIILRKKCFLSFRNRVNYCYFQFVYCEFCLNHRFKNCTLPGQWPLLGITPHICCGHQHVCSLTLCQYEYPRMILLLPSLLVGIWLQTVLVIVAKQSLSSLKMFYSSLVESWLTGWCFFLGQHPLSSTVI